MNKKVSVFLAGTVLAAGVGIWGLEAGTVATPAYAETTNAATVGNRETNLASGTYGTVNWYLTANGELHLGAGALGEDTSLPAQVGRLAAQIAKAQGVTDPTKAQVQTAADQVTKVVLDGPVVAPVDASSLFSQLRNVTTYEHLDRLDTSHTTVMNNMFHVIDLDSKTTTIDVSHFDTSQVTSMQYMFYGQSAVKQLDVTGFNMDRVTDTMDMFYRTTSLEQVDFAQGTFHNLSSVMYMFGFSGAQVIKLPKFAPSADFSGFYMFAGTKIITELTLGPATTFKSGTSPNLNTPLQDMPDVYTGLWQAVGKGTVGNPLGDEYATGNAITTLYTGDAKPTTVETYVWQPVNRVIEPTTPPTTPNELAQPVTVQYRDNQGKQLADDVTLTGDLGTHYQAEPLTFNGYKLTKTDGEATGTFTTQPQTVTFHYAPSLVTGGDGDAIAPISSVVYATRKIGLYRTKNFSNQSRVHWYKKVKRAERPMFVVTGTATSKRGNLRYKVRDVNHHSKTAGKTGYITAKKSYVTSVYYATKQPRIKVINAQGINAYRQKSLKTAQRHYRKGQTLRVKKIVQYNKTTRFQLTNGQYVTANKKLVIAEK
ncbi:MULTISPECIES: DUF5776 domain-containing protein [Lactobacillaceae]|uniref:MucBP domain-containing protein n=1 Tax=Lactobacillaceae TaxID=33958 RepID=UPI0014570D63|nr:DUF5776 domain-containing protein [Lactobacillus sp. HBUAS51381]NLR09495.1 BspA family leucine-rich repeat surface protein [Lactobacillus sp. HBUAS51381]